MMTLNGKEIKTILVDTWTGEQKPTKLWFSHQTQEVSNFTSATPETTYIAGVDFAQGKDKTAKTVCVRCQRCNNTYIFGPLSVCPYCGTPA